MKITKVGGHNLQGCYTTSPELLWGLASFYFLEEFFDTSSPDTLRSDLDRTALFRYLPTPRDSLPATLSLAVASHNMDVPRALTYRVAFDCVSNRNSLCHRQELDRSDRESFGARCGGLQYRFLHCASLTAHAETIVITGVMFDVSLAVCTVETCTLGVGLSDASGFVAWLDAAGTKTERAGKGFVCRT